MTTFGKVLAFVNLVVGLSLLAWGVSVYANRVDWVDRKTDTGTEEGEITRLKKEIDKLTRSVADTDAAYATRSDYLVKLEAQRDYRKAKLDARLAEARRGTFKVQVPLANDPSFVDVDNDKGPPVLAPDGKPLRGVDVLTKEFNDQVRQAQLHRQGEKPVQPNEWNDLRALVTNERLATLGIDDLRTLHGRLSDAVAAEDVAIGKQRDVLTNLRDEAAYLADNRVNWAAQLQTLERRQKQLEDRLRELGAADR
jgi:chromosome segregation ATPase